MLDRSFTIDVPNAITDGTQRTEIREKIEFPLAVISAYS